MPKVRCSCEEDQGFCIICGAKLEKAGAGAAYQAEPERPAGPRICELWEGASAADAFLYILRDKNELVRRSFLYIRI